jgi:hypothetical protein
MTSTIAGALDEGSHFVYGDSLYVLIKKPEKNGLIGIVYRFDTLEVLQFPLVYVVVPVLIENSELNIKHAQYLVPGRLQFTMNAIFSGV